MIRLLTEAESAIYRAKAQAEADAYAARHNAPSAPAVGTLWRHRNGAIYEVAGHAKGRISGGIWRMGVIYRSREDANACYWRSLADWRMSFSPAEEEASITATEDAK